MPRQRKPNEMHVKTGTFRKDRHGPRALVAVPAIDRPVTVTASATEILDRVMTTGVAWLAESDAPTVVLLRETLERREAVADIDPREWRELTVVAAKLMSQLGLDPSARSPLGLAEVRAASKLDALKARHGQVTPSRAMEGAPHGR